MLVVCAASLFVKKRVLVETAVTVVVLVEGGRQLVSMWPPESATGITPGVHVTEPMSSCVTVLVECPESTFVALG